MTIDNSEESPINDSQWYNFILGKAAQNFILAIIIMNAITLGLETSPFIMERVGGALKTFELVALGIYTVELTLKFLALQGRFFKSGWNIFDLIIVLMAYIPATGPLAVLRSLRVLRVLRLISAVPQLRIIIRSLVASLPSIGWITFLLFMMFYIFAVMATHLFGKTFPMWFGSIGESYYTLFQILTLESWSMGIVRPIMDVYPYAWAFFVPFVLMTSFVVLNVFIAVIVGAMSDIRSDEKMNDAVTDLETQNKSPSKMLEQEFISLHAQLTRLEALSKMLDKQEQLQNRENV